MSLETSDCKIQGECQWCERKFYVPIKVARMPDWWHYYAEVGLDGFGPACDDCIEQYGLEVQK